MDAWAVAIVGGLGASILFLVALSLLRPRLTISHEISRTPTDGPVGEVRYRIKVVNKSRRSCVDVLVKGYLVRRRDVPGEKDGQISSCYVLKSVGLRRSEGFIPGYRKRDHAAHYAQRIRIDDATMIEWGADSDRYLLVRIVARDGVTGFPRSFSREYKLGSQVHDGTFRAGISTAIVPWTRRGATGHGTVSEAIHTQPATSSRGIQE